jgi:3-dehydroquinate synthase
VAEAVERIGPRPPVSDVRPAAILEAIGRDKKAKAGKVPFILPTAIGQVVIHDDVGPAEVRDALRAMGRREATTRRAKRPVRSVR